MFDMRELIRSNMIDKFEKNKEVVYGGSRGCWDLVEERERKRKKVEE